MFKSPSPLDTLPPSGAASAQPLRMPGPVDRRTALARLAGCVFATAPWAPAFAGPAAVSELVRWPEVTLLDGTRWTAAQAEGRAVVVVFWSTTCPFCRRHNAHLERLRQAAAGSALQILTVARENDPQAVRHALADNGWRFAVTLDSQPMAAALSMRKVVPLTITVGRHGHLEQVIPGEMFEEDVLELLQLAV